MLLRKLKGGVLFFATGISIVIALLLMSVILCYDLNTRLVLNDKVKFTLINNSESGIIAALQFAEPGNYNVDLFNRGNDSVLITITPWGLFDLCKSEAHFRQERFSSYALLGNRIAAEEDYAIWLADMDRPLFVCGKTSISGTAYLPKVGVERSYIEGRVYEGNELIHGTQIQSTRFIRRPDNTTNGRFQFMVQPAEIISDSIITLNEMLYIDTIQNTFSRGTVAIVSDRNISIVKKTIIDNVFIIASSRIEVQDCYLRNVILMAPEIIIKSGTYDGIQCFASDSIHVDSAVALNYPSALILKPIELSCSHPDINIASGAKIGGDIIAFNPFTFNRFKIGIAIAPETRIYGRIYCSDWIELKGKVCGSITCNQLLLRTNSAQYQNHLLDATIDNITFKNDYTSSVFFTSEISSRGIAKWIK